MKKISKVFLHCFGVGVTLCLFAGALALIGFVVALCIGGNVATDICVFIHKSYFPWVIRFTTVFAAFGLVGMYLNKMRSLTISSSEDTSKDVSNTEDNQ